MRRNAPAIVTALTFMAGMAFADDPVLMIDTGGHTAAIRSLLFTADSRFLISAGDDKVARIWDVAAGKTIATLRGQIGSGVEGMIYAAALSPDQKYVALAGHLPNYGIRIHALQSGEVVAVLKGHTSTIECLAFTRDGRLLASGDSAGLVRLWDMSRMTSVRELRGHTDRVHTLSFSPDGNRLVSAGFDLTLRVWNTSNGSQVQQWRGPRNTVVSALFSPDGSTLVSASEDGDVRFWNPRTGATVSLIEGAAFRPANLSFTSDGTRLLMTSAGNGRSAASIYSISSRSVTATFRGQDGVITATALSPDGRTAATAGGPGNEIWLWEVESGKPVRKLAGQGRPVWNVAFAAGQDSPIGAILLARRRFDSTAPNAYGPLDDRMWFNRVAGQYVLEWDTGKPSGEPAITAVDHLDNALLRTATGPAGDVNASLQLVRNGQVTRQFVRDGTSGYRHTCFSFTPDGRVVSGGMNGMLFLYSDDGRPQTFVGHTGTITAVSVSPDGRTLLSSSDDQTVRLWDLGTRRNVLTIFIGAERQWVAWTPEGYYASTVNGEKFIGWHLNQGESRAAKFWSVAAFRKEFDRPDIIAEQLKSHDIDRAVRLANAAKGLPQRPPADAAEVARITPPEIRFVTPAADGIVTDASPGVTAFAFSTTLPIKDAALILNGQQVQSFPGKGQSVDIAASVQLQPGDNTLTIRVSNEKGINAEQVRRLKYTPAAPVAVRKPNLIFLGIGISRYKTQGISLQFADRDAEQIRDVFLQQQNGQLYGRVQAEVLTNERASRAAILEKLEWFKNAGSEGDVRILFVAGHGERWGPRNEYFFCAYEHEPGKSAELYDIRWNILLDSLTAVPGKAVLMIDTCHAAAVSGGGRRGVQPVDMDGLIAEFKGTPGIVVFAAATGTESSIESDEWKHGAFTAAVLEGLGVAGRSGKVTGTNGVIRTSDLAQWVTTQVPEMTRTLQHPVVYHIPEDQLLPFPIFARQ